MSSRNALIIATGKYNSVKLKQLRAPAKDADALARVLKDPRIGEFDVELIENKPEWVLRREIEGFFANRRRDDLLLLHMSCHGLKNDEGNLFFAASDTDLERLDSTAVSDQFVRDQFIKSRAGSIVLLLDCCYSGAFSHGVSPKAGGGVELKERFAGRGRAVITASNAMEYAFEGDKLSGKGEPSIFTSAIVEALETGKADRNLDGWIGVHELYDYVFGQVRDKSPQHPVEWVDMEGDFQIARSIYEPPVKPAELSPDLQAAIESPDRHARLGAVVQLTELATDEDLAVRKAARLALECLTKDDSHRVSEAARQALAMAPPEPVETTAAPEASELRASPKLVEERASQDGVEERAAQQLAGLGGMRLAAACAVGGAIAVLVSVIAHDSAQNFDRSFFRVPIALMALGAIALVVWALRADRRTPLLAAAAVALVLLGAAFPMSWRPGPLPTTVPFWLGAVGAAVSAAGAVFAAWRAYPEAPGTGRLGGVPGQTLLVIPGPVITVASLFVLREWSSENLSANTTWMNWHNDNLLRYPSTIVLLSAVTLVLAVVGIRRNRTHLLAAGAGCACLLLGETIPLIFPTISDWGSGRWLRIAGAAITLVGVGAVAVPTRGTTTTPTGEGMPGGPSAIPTSA